MIDSENLYYPGTAVFVNKFGIRDAETARALEYKFASVRELELAASPVKPPAYDFDHLKAIHRHVYQDLYEWAGQERNTGLAHRDRQTGLANRFTAPAELEKKGAEFDKYLSDNDYLRGLPKPEFIKKMAEVQTRLSEMSPFRTGNDRVARIYMGQLARQAGYDLDLTKMDQDRWERAKHLSLPRHDPKNPARSEPGMQMEMRQLFHEASRPNLAHAFEHLPREQAMQQHPSLAPAYQQLDRVVAETARLGDEGTTAVIERYERARITRVLVDAVLRSERTAAEKRLKQEHALDRPNAQGRSIVPIVATQVLTERGFALTAINATIERATRSETGPTPRPQPTAITHEKTR